MFDRATKEELAILLPNTMPEHLHHVPNPAPAPVARRSVLLARLGAMLRWADRLLNPSAIIWTR